MKVKNSFGIALLRFNYIKNKYEILIVKKRVSYAFVDFVNGNYIKNTDNLKFLFNNMSNDEKIDILRGDYDSLYYKVFLQKPPQLYPINIYEQNIQDYFDPLHYYEIKNFLKKKSYFERLFNENNNEYIKFLIRNTRNNSIIYEIPKGRLLRKEKPLDGAIREFYEETLIPKESYNIISPETITYTFVSNNVRYNIEYFVGFTNKQDDVKLNFNMEQISEIDEIRWMGMDEIRFIEQTNTNNKKISEVFKNAKLLYKKVTTN